MNAMNRKKTIQRIKKKLKEREKDKENNVKDLTTSHSCDDILHTYSGIPKNDNTLPHSPSKKGTAIDRLVLGLYMLYSEKVQKKYKQKFVELRNNLYKFLFILYYFYQFIPISCISWCAVFTFSCPWMINALCCKTNGILPHCGIH